MFTRCPNCQATHAVSASLLAHAGGSVRCGDCGRQFDALAFLFDDWPRPGSRPPVIGSGSGPPLLGARSFSAHPPREKEASGCRKAPGGDPNRAAWIAVLTILVLITLSNLSWSFREPLLEQAQVKALLVHLNLVEAEPETPFTDPARIQLVSRDVHAHPTRAGMLVLSATFVNRAPRSQAWPRLELTLLDAANTPLARRSFSPSQYLPGGGAHAPLLGTQVHVPVLLEFASPGAQAVGFELKFH